MATAFPPLFAIDTAVLKNSVRQVAELRPAHNVAPVPFTKGKTKGLLFSASGEEPEVLAVPFRTKESVAGHERVVEGDIRDADRLVKGRWMRHPMFNSAPTSADCERAQSETLASWENAFSYVAEDRANGVFGLVTERRSAVFELILFEVDGVKDYRIEQQTEDQVFVKYGRQRVSAAQFFTNDPPTFWFADGAALEGSTHVPLRFTRPPYPAERIEVWDWTGVNIRHESQKLDKRPESIQARVIQRLLQAGDYTIVFDDDASGEAADVVAIKLIGSVTDPRAQALAIADNRVGELDLEWDVDGLKQWQADAIVTTS